MKDGIGRYTVLWCPHSYGYPYNTDSYMVALMVWLRRNMGCMISMNVYPHDAIIIDNGKEYV